MTVEEVAEKLLCSATKISRLETGARRPSLRDVRDLCELYEVDESTSVDLMSLAREARVPGWWTQYDDLDLDPLIGLEEAATSITCYSMNYIPGLLQTEEYADGIIRIIAPKMDPQVVRQRVEVRLRRQQVLDENNPPLYRVLLDESVLRRGVGGPMLMAAQIEKLLKAVANGKVVVQIIPFDAGAYSAADGYFVLLEFAEAQDLRPIVFIEGLAGNQYLDRKADIARYRETIDYLRARAMSPADSAKLMTKARNTLRQQGNNHAHGLVRLAKEGLYVSAARDLDWRVSRTCDNGQCVKVARNGEVVVIGNTSSPEGPFSEFTVEEWRHFLAGVKLGDFDGIV